MFCRIVSQDSGIWGTEKVMKKKRKADMSDGERKWGQRQIPRDVVGVLVFSLAQSQPRPE